MTMHHPGEPTSSPRETSGLDFPPTSGFLSTVDSTLMQVARMGHDIKTNSSRKMWDSTRPHSLLLLAFLYKALQIKIRAVQKSIIRQDRPPVEVR